MAAYCCVKGCSINSSTQMKNQHSTLTFHAFPSKPEQKTKWLKAIGCPNWMPSSHASICSSHFDKKYIVYEGGQLVIKDNAVPTKNLQHYINFNAAAVEACRICLATDLKMYNLQGQLGNYMDSIAGINEYNSKGLPQYICYECAACLTKCHKLMEKSMIAQATLLDLFWKYGEVNKSLIQKQNRNELNLNSSVSFCEPGTCHVFDYFEVANIENDGIDFKIGKEETDLSLKTEMENEKTEYKIEINKGKVEMVLNNLNEIHDNYEYLGDSSKGSSSGKYISDNETEEAVVQCSNIKEKKKITKEYSVKKKTVRKRKRSLVENSTSDIDKTEEAVVQCSNIKGKRKILKKKTGSNKINLLSPDDMAMQKYFKIVLLTPQEQIEEWQTTISNKEFNSSIVYECEVCGKKFVNRSSCQEHASGHNPSRGKAECPVCKLRYKNKTRANAHLNHAHAKKFHCKTCPKVYHNSAMAKRHHRRHAGHTYKCQECPFSSLSQVVMSDHKRRKHAQYPCPYCGRDFVSSTGLSLHISAVHGLVREEGIETPFPCEFCDINFTTEEARRVHVLISKKHNHQDSPHASLPENLLNTCRKCGVECTSTKELADHNRTKHPIYRLKNQNNVVCYPIECELCGEIIPSRIKHWYHVRQKHKKEKTDYSPLVAVVCEICGKGFHNNGVLQKHQLRHDVKTFKCILCSRMFHDKYRLAQHTLTHTDRKPYECRTCGATFRERSNLTRHYKTHSDLRAYECTYCGKTFKHSSSLNLHVRTVHYKLPYPPRKKRNKSTKGGKVKANGSEDP